MGFVMDNAFHATTFYSHQELIKVRQCPSLLDLVAMILNSRLPCDYHDICSMSSRYSVY